METAGRCSSSRSRIRSLSCTQAGSPRRAAASIKIRMHDLKRAVAAEAVGTAMLLAIVAGSGIMGERLAGGNQAVALLANSLATGAGLYALIVIFAPISG